MGTTRHSLAQFEGTGPLFIGGKITNNAGSVSISSTVGLTGPLMQNTDVTVVRTALGAYTLTINPFIGPLGGVVHAITAQTNGTAIGVCATHVYTGTSLAVSIVLVSTGTATPTGVADADVNFLIFGF